MDTDKGKRQTRIARIFTNLTEGNEANEDLTESLRDRIMGKANSENLRGLRKSSWIVVQMDTDLNPEGSGLRKLSRNGKQPFPPSPFPFSSPLVQINGWAAAGSKTF